MVVIVSMYRPGRGQGEGSGGGRRGRGWEGKLMGGKEEDSCAAKMTENSTTKKK